MSIPERFRNPSWPRPAYRLVGPDEQLPMRSVYDEDDLADEDDDGEWNWVDFPGLVDDDEPVAEEDLPEVSRVRPDFWHPCRPLPGRGDPEQGDWIEDVDGEEVDFDGHIIEVSRVWPDLDPLDDLDDEPA